MKNLKLEKHEYTIWDFLKIPFSVAPVMAFIRVLFDKIIFAMIPSLQVLAMANFVDTTIDIYNGKADKSQLVLPIVSIVLLISYEYVMILSGFAREKLNMKLTETFQTAVMEKRAKLEYHHVENNDTWDLIERVGKKPADRIDNGFDNLMSILELIIRIGSVLLILLVQVWWAALVIIAFSIPLFKLSIKSGKINYEASKEAAKYTRRAGYIQELLIGRDNVEERAIFNYSEDLNRRYKDKYVTAFKINFKTQLNRFIKMKSSSIITIVIAVLISAVLITTLGSGKISIGMFMSLVNAAFGLVFMMSWELMYVTSELATCKEYMCDLTIFSGLSETSGATDLPYPDIYEPSCIEFIDVSFAYPGTDALILQDLCMKLYTGKHYAFVGANGAGKSTITKLLTGLYDNYTGEILIDGINLRDFSQAQLKSLFSVVYQDFAKYQIPLIDSIAVGNVRDISNTNVVEAINNLGLNDAVAKLPDGINNPLGKIKRNGIDLSGGEWQRVAIARSLVNNAPIRILDEPTAALDPVAESALYELLGMISQGKSTIFITHRLGASKLADEIFVISGGQVAEQGSHDELLRENGIYAEMFEAQRGWYV